MNKSDIKELHYIAHVNNLKSILQHGIMSHNKAKGISYTSVSDPEVQEIRSKVVIPPKYKLHDYVNLYFNARNPMMFRIVKNRNHKELVVLKIDVATLDINGVVIADKNASSEYAGFYNISDGIRRLEKNRVYVRYWNDPNPIEKYRKTSEICAEVLVPDTLHPKFITGCYVSCHESLDKIKILLTGTRIANKVSINPDIFFQ